MVNAEAAEDSQVLFLNVSRILRTRLSILRAPQAALVRNLLALSARKNLNLSRKIFTRPPSRPGAASWPIFLTRRSETEATASRSPSTGSSGQTI